MAYEATGLQALFPVYLARTIKDGERRDELDASIAQNETNLNQNLDALYQKLLALEDALAAATQEA